MASVTFSLVLLGTFITRSGIIQSVHSFGNDPLSFWAFLIMIGLCLVVPGVMLVVRSERFKGDEEFTSLLSKDSSYFFNTLFMLLSALLVAGLTLSPAFHGATYSAASFNLIARPLGIFYVMLMTVCPILSWGVTEPATFWKRAKWPAIIGGVLAAVFLVMWATVLLPNYTPGTAGLPALVGIQAPLDHVESIWGLIVAGFAIALPIYLFADGARKRAAALGESPLIALRDIVFKSRSQSGGYIAHLGIGIVLIGLIGSTMYVKDSQFTLPAQPGASHAVGAYGVVLEGTNQQTLSNGDEVQTVAVDLMKNGVLIGRVYPQATQLANRSSGQSTTLEAAIHSEFFRDLFVAFQGGDATGYSFDVKINPLVSWVWAGFGLLILGTAIAAWPRKGLPVAEVRAPKKKRAA
jgi:cytochrome c-type biogenesis protein CcmF